MRSEEILLEFHSYSPLYNAQTVKILLENSWKKQGKSKVYIFNKNQYIYNINIQFCLCIKKKQYMSLSLSFTIPCNGLDYTPNMLKIQAGFDGLNCKDTGRWKTVLAQSLQ